MVCWVVAVFGEVSDAFLRLSASELTSLQVTRSRLLDFDFESGCLSTAIVRA